MSLELAPEPGRREDLPLELSDEQESVKITGFWMFLVTDVLIFASLFSAYAVYRPRVATGPGPLELFHFGPALLETLLLLTSSFTVGIAIYEMRKGRPGGVMAWTIATLALGAAFVFLEIHEFASYAALGATWHQSAFLSAFYVLVGTHGAHVSFGILWAVTLLVQLARRGLTPVTARKLYTFSLYWHFLDVVWVFIFTVVYLMGKIA